MTPPSFSLIITSYEYGMVGSGNTNTETLHVQTDRSGMLNDVQITEIRCGDTHTLLIQ